MLRELFDELLGFLLNVVEKLPVFLIKAGVVMQKKELLKTIEARADAVDFEADKMPAEVRACFEAPGPVKLELPRIKSLEEALNQIDSGSSLLHLCLEHGDSQTLHWLL